MKEICEHCRKSRSVLISKGPMIWFQDKSGERRGLYRPEKSLCLDCAQLPTETIWPITDINDSRLHV